MYTYCNLIGYFNGDRDLWKHLDSRVLTKVLLVVLHINVFSFQSVFDRIWNEIRTKSLTLEWHGCNRCKVDDIFKKKILLVLFRRNLDFMIAPRFESGITFLLIDVEILVELLKTSLQLPTHLFGQISINSLLLRLNKIKWIFKIHRVMILF